MTSAFVGPGPTKSFIRSIGGVMRLLVVAAALGLSVVGLSMADDAKAMSRKPTNIPAERLVPALKQLAHERGFQLVFQSEVVGSALTHGATGEFTTAEALSKLLEGTNLVYRYLDDKTVTILKASDGSGPGAAPSQPASAPPSTSNSQQRENARTGPLLVAQAVPGSDQSTSSVATPRQKSADEAELQEVHPNTPEILIKGSRIMNVDVKRTEDDVQPYTIFTSQQIEQSGATNVEDFLKQQLTMNTTVTTNAQFSPVANGGGTTSSINLRGLGTNETLILVDGRRSAGVNVENFNGSFGQPDVNGIPLAAIERIEVLPSSASAIYGGAAVGGVVNIVLKKSFDGGDLRYTYDKPTQSGANSRTVSGSYGTSLFAGQTQFMVGGQYSDGSPLQLGDRSNLVGRGIANIIANAPSYLYNASNPFAGAATNIGSADGTYNSNFTVFTPVPLTLRNGTPLNSAITTIPRGIAPGANPSAALLANAGTFNLNSPPGVGPYGSESPIGTTPLTKSLFATIRQRLFDDVQLFAEFSTSSNEGRATIAPFNGPWYVPSSAPDNPFQQDVNVNFPSATGSAMTSDNVTQAATVGMVAPLSHGWSSEIDYTWSRDSFEYGYGVADASALASALSAGTLNPFVDTIAYPLKLAPYLGQFGYSGGSTLNDVNVRMSGPIGSLPAGSATLTIGLEHREEGNSDAPQSSDLPISSENDQAVVFFGHSQSTNSIYAEALVPLVAPHNELPVIHSLDLQIAGRSERYQVFAGTAYDYLAPAYLVPFNPPQGVHSTITYTSTNPTIGLKYQPVADVTVRTSYATAFLPPTVTQLLPNPTSVCDGSPCQQITDPRNGQTYLVDETGGGNPSLAPQRSRDWDLGLIWEPQEEALRGLRMDLEYYRIVQPNYITTPTAQQVVSDPALANRVTRNPTTGLITSVDASYVNANEYKTSGYDLKIDYRKATALGTFDAHAAGTLINYDLRQLAIGSPFLEYAGFPNDGGEAKVKANATLSWEYRRWTAAWSTTYYSSYKPYDSPGSPIYVQYGTLSLAAAAQGASTIPSQIYHDIFFSYVFDKGGHGGRVADALLSNLTVQFGIKNVFNTLPPFDAYAPYYYSTYGDARLRDFRISVEKSF